MNNTKTVLIMNGLWISRAVTNSKLTVIFEPDCVLNLLGND